MQIILTALALTMGGLQEPPAPAAATAAESGDHRALAALNSAWLNSYVTRDADALDAILADDFVAVYGGGIRRTKAEVIARVVQSRQSIVSVRAENLAIHVSGDVAVVTARSVLGIGNDEHVSEVRNDYADVYVRRDGRWRAILAHIVRVAAAS